MRTATLTALLAVAMAAPAFPDEGRGGWKGLGSQWGAQFWGWNDNGDEGDDDGDVDGGWRQYRYYRAPSGYRPPYVEPREFTNARRNARALAGYELLEMDYRSLRGVLRAAAADFDRWLKGIPAGEVWRKHFETRTIQAVSASEENTSPAHAERETIMRVIEIFDRAVESPDLRDLSSLDSFRTLHVALREIVVPPEERLLRQLSFHARNLNRAVGAFNTGVTWQRYLALPDVIVAAADRPLGEVTARSQPDPEALRQILDRFESVANSEEFRAISSLPEFRATHQRLAALVKSLREVPTSVPAAPEELPPP